MSNGTSTSVGYLRPKHPCRRAAVILSNPKLDKWVHTFPKGKSLKVAEIVRLDLELVYHQAVVLYFSYYATGTPFLFNSSFGVLIVGLFTKIYIVFSLNICYSVCVTFLTLWW